MKVALPVAALALIAAVVAWPGGDASRPGALPISFANIKIDPTGLTMKSPRFVGVDNQGQAYTVTADEAVQDKADERAAVELHHQIEIAIFRFVTVEQNTIAEHDAGIRRGEVDGQLGAGELEQAGPGVGPQDRIFHQMHARPIR
jgi:hypothetical protein